MKLSLTKAALNDLQSIRAYTLKTWGEDQEEIYLEKMWNRIQSLQADPLRYRHRDELFPGCRIASEGRHVIFFHHEDQLLTIVRVLHSAMDFKSHLDHFSDGVAEKAETKMSKYKA